MSQAVGIHAHPERKLGRRPEDPTRAKLDFAEYVKAVPSHPIADPQPAWAYPMDRNDQAGDCVVAAWDHAAQIIFTSLGGSYTAMTDDELLHAYQSQNPDFHSWADAGTAADQGMIVAKFLSWLIEQGKILGYAKVDLTNYEQAKAAVYLGLAVITGEDLTEAQQNGQVWDYVPDSPNWGGHATVWGGYGQRISVVSWGSGDYSMTDTFVHHQVSEAYFIVTQAHVEHPGFRAGYDVAKFAADYEAITGKKFPAIPSPQPPQPGAASFPGADSWVDTRIVAAAHRRKMSTSEWLNRHFDVYFHLP